MAIAVLLLTLVAHTGSLPLELEQAISPLRGQPIYVEYDYTAISGYTSRKGWNLRGRAWFDGSQRFRVDSFTEEGERYSTLLSEGDKYYFHGDKTVHVGMKPPVTVIEALYGPAPQVPTNLRFRTYKLGSELHVWGRYSLDPSLGGKEHKWTLIGSPPRVRTYSMAFEGRGAARRTGTDLRFDHMFTRDEERIGIRKLKVGRIDDRVFKVTFPGYRVVPPIHRS